jgi:hypothetical protein
MLLAKERESNDSVIWKALTANEQKCMLLHRQIAEMKNSIDRKIQDIKVENEGMLRQSNHFLTH